MRQDPGNPPMMAGFPIPVSKRDKHDPRQGESCLGVGIGNLAGNPVLYIGLEHRDGTALVGVLPSSLFAKFAALINSRADMIQAGAADRAESEQ